MVNPSNWRQEGIPNVALVACLAWSGITPALADPQRALDRLREAIEKRQAAATPRQTLAEHLARWVESDARFDPERHAATLSFAMRNTFYGLQPLLDDSLAVQFLGLSSDSLRGEWLRRYWVFRDPTPTTRANERREEHERRVRFAREHFALLEPPYWDDRGRFCILYGPPETSRQIGADVHAGIGYVPEQLVWLYPRERLLVRFVRHNPPDGPWRIGVAGKSFTNRPDAARDATHGMIDLATGFGPRATIHDEEHRPPLPPMDPEYAGWVDLSMAAASEVVESQRERFELPGPPRPFLWFVFDTDAFRAPVSAHRGGNATYRLEAHLQFLATALHSRSEDSRSTAHYHAEGVLLDEDLREVARDAYQTTLSAPHADSTATARLWPAQLGFTVPPGNYRMALRLADLRTGSEGTYVSDVSVPAPGPSRLALSDVELATGITPATDQPTSRFEKNGRLVFPNPIGFYSATQPLTAYFEIYGLTLAGDGQGRYSVSYQVVARPEDKSTRNDREPQQPSVTASFVSSTDVTDPVEELRVDIRSLSEKSYELIIRVEDLVAGGEASARTTFTVIRL